MSGLLSNDEIRFYYNEIRRKTGYIKTLKKNLNEIQLRQILDYAGEVCNEASLRLNGYPDVPFDWPYVLPSYINNEVQLNDYVIFSEGIIKILEYNMNPVHRKREVNPNLRLSDVLIEGVSVSEVKSWYNFRKHKKIYLGQFLRILQNMGYFNRKLLSKEFTIIGRNDFDDATYKDRNDYKPPALKDLWNHPKFRDIPRPPSKKSI